jgi:sugar/nucleoside kinase (ribokinase family)|tara:strand:- start:2183 stop:2995 length:813 start_codon:yes stop_codon:yes gene_type:complete
VKVVCAGDCGVDRYVDLGIDRPGGKTLNVAATARQLFPRSTDVSVVTALGTDEEARFVAAAIRDHGLTGSVVHRRGRTSVQQIDRSPAGEKIFLEYDQGVLGGYRPDPAARELIAAADLLVTPLYVEIHGFFDSVIATPSAGLRVVDFSDLSDFDSDPAIVDRYADRFDIGFFGLSLAAPNLIASLEVLARLRRKLFIVTLGADGSLAVGGADRIRCQAVPVPAVVDTTGAGDVFAAGFLREYCTSRDVAASLRAGSLVAAESIQRIGAF